MKLFYQKCISEKDKAQVIGLTITELLYLELRVVSGYGPASGVFSFPL